MRRLRRYVVPTISIIGLWIYVLGAAVAAKNSAGQSQAGTLLLAPNDTYLNTNLLNYSTSTTVSTYTWPDYQRANVILMKFDFSALPAGAVVTDATLHLQLTANDDSADSTYAVSAHKVLTRNPNIARATGFTADGVLPWTPNICCLSNAPLAQADVSPAYDTREIDKVKNFKTWNLTTMVQEWLLTPTSNMGVLLNSDPTKQKDRYRTFASVEHSDAALRPYLKITYLASDVTPPTVTLTAPAAGEVSGTVPLSANATDNLGIAGVQFRINGTPLGPEQTAHPYGFNWDTTAYSDGTYTITATARDNTGITALSAGVSVTVTNGVLALQPLDTTLNINATNHSAEQMLMTYTWPDYKMANAILMKFDLSAVPAGAVVQEAKLFLALVQSDTKADNTYTITASKVLTHNPVITQATGYTADGTTAWTPNACCYNGVPLAQADILAPYDTQAVDKTPGFKSWTLTTMLHEWLANPSTNFGVLLGSDATKTADHHRFFASMEHADSTLRPFLRIIYSLSGDSTPPAIAGVTASGITQNSATISWTTDEAADGQVEYGTTTAYGSLSPLDSASATAHSITLTGLNDARQYYYRVLSRDQAGNLATSSNSTFTTLDGTLPSVSLTAPATGTSLSATVNVTANATDNVGVVGVQFKLDGANLGAEDTTAPYSVSWNTTTAADGNHALTAVARDAAGNVATAASIAVTVTNAPPPPPPPPGGGLAAQYPGDVGIENDPNVVLVERFDESTLANLFGRWTDVMNGTAMSFSADAPAGSPVGKSLNIPWSSGNTGGHLYRQLSQGVDDVLYVRYYVKYPANNSYNHTGIWMGGYNPPLGWPNPQAGVKPTGSDRFMAAAEQNTLTNRFDHYDYWMGMQPGGDGSHWGNLLLNDPTVQAGADQWTCVEQMVKLNNPVSAANGEHAIWLNGVKVSHLGPGFPNGNWSGGTFTQDLAGSPFPGFQWRNTASLNLNWLWLQVYATSGSGNLKYAHVVAAKSYIGCLASGTPSTPPTVSMTAPVTGATVSGTTTLSASASDDVGVTGVQFKLNGTNLGVEDTTAPYSIAWNTATVANGSHVLTAVARDGAGNTTTSVAVTITVSNTGGSGSWPNDPPSFVTVNDQPWNSLTGNGWNFLRRSASKDPDIVADPNAPFSAPNTMRMIFTTDMNRDSEPSVHWIGLPMPREVYAGWWMKVSPNWACSPAGCGKITFLFPSDANGAGVTYSNLANAGNGSHYVNIATTWPSTGYRFWEPNVTRTEIPRGQWFRVEWYVKWASSPGASDGIIRWWVNGVLNGSYTNVPFPSIAGFVEFQHAPTLQDVPNAEQYMYIDHTRVRTP